MVCWRGGEASSLGRRRQTCRCPPRHPCTSLQQITGPPPFCGPVCWENVPMFPQTHPLYTFLRAELPPEWPRFDRSSIRFCAIVRAEPATAIPAEQHKATQQREGATQATQASQATLQRGFAVEAESEKRSQRIFGRRRVTSSFPVSRFPSHANLFFLRSWSAFSPMLAARRWTAVHVSLDDARLLRHGTPKLPAEARPEHQYIAPIG